MKKASEFVFVFGIFLMFFLLGCTTKVEQECQRYTNEQKIDCIRYYAILKQTPELCYQISDLNVRKECMQKATEPKEAKKLEVQLEFSKRMEQKQNEQKAEPSSFEYLVKQCMEKELKTKDNCLFDIAKAKEEMKLCDEIVSEEIHRRCIVSIASTAKTPKVCQELKLEADRQLCLFYTS
ncbi:MAG: hypothetical protein N3D10_00200 [Candidatus Micrarchaeota archaeon]|nr:hypothetical protein [Candidatus Micrarchaeota archaeon]